jgi:hypothetical protein
LIVDPDNKVSSIKEMIYEEHEIEGNKYHLKLGGTILKDDQTIHHQNIVADTTLTLDYHNLKLSVEMPNGLTFDM